MACRGLTPMQREATGAVADEWSVHSSPQRDALRDVPAQVRAHGLRSAHPRPLVSFGKQAGGQFNSFRVPPERAWQYPEVEYGNAGSSVAALVLDCDNPNARAEGLFNLPPPNWIVWRLENGHVHVCWTLAIPVHRYPEAHLEPLRYLAYIAEYFAYAVGADPGYAGVLAHNPVLTRWTPYETVWGWKESRTLHQYAEVIPFGWKPPKVAADKRRQKCRSIRGRDAMGGARGERRLAGAPGVDVAQSELHSPASTV